MNLNNLLPGIAFTFLLLLMLLYWLQAAFFGKERYRSFNNFMSLLSLSSLTLLLTLRWIESGHFPLSNLYESLLFLSWCFLSLKILFAFDIKGTKRALTLPCYTEGEYAQPLPLPLPGGHGHGQERFGHRQQEERKAEQDTSLGLGVVLSPLALLTFGFAFLSLPKEMQKATTLVPALQSNWLMMHVTVMLLSYAALLSGSVLSIVFLILSSLEEGKSTWAQDSVSANPISNSFYPPENEARPLPLPCAYAQPLPLPLPGGHGHGDGDHLQKKSSSTALSLTDKLDNYSYRVLALGFPLLTIGILSGAVWANEAWGSYWSWDPKETWALITWLVFAIYLHMRITRGWSGKKSAVVASAGFFVVWFCYLGVNLLGSGLHSYGWFSK